MLALGKTIHGEPFFFDLATMPHLLIAGSTGTGKSVGLNAMLTEHPLSRDARRRADDHAGSEAPRTGDDEDIPHLLSPVVMDPKLAANALRWAVREMEERYKTLAAEGVRNIDQFNRNIRLKIEGGEKDEETGELPKPLPLHRRRHRRARGPDDGGGQRSRRSRSAASRRWRAPVGIHLILATQRPSVDVITGLIKANLPARISFRVSSKTDSRTILDGNGAEQLLGKRRHAVPAARIVALHPPARRLHLGTGERASRELPAETGHGRSYDATITDEEKTARSRACSSRRTTLYDEAARIIVQSGQASISYLQRRLRIGFSRAARLVGHDGSRRPGVERQRRQGPRSPGEQGLLRRGRRTGPLAARWVEGVDV